MIEVKMQIRDVDYAAAVDVLMPVLLDKLSTSANPIVSLVLGKTKDLSSSAVKAALDVLPKSMRDELAAACLNHYSGEISQLIVNMANQKNIRIKAESLEIAAQD